MTSEPKDASPRWVFRVLCVCTGNIYRSRIAEYTLREELASRLGAEATQFVISSAGTRASNGQPLSLNYLRDLARLGLRTNALGDTHRLEEPDIAAADLVLTAERHHRAAALELMPGALRRSFTLSEFARVAGAATQRAGSAGSEDVDLVHRARRVVAAAAKYRGSVPPGISDDIADPWGLDDQGLELAARQVRDAVARAVDALVG